MYIAVEKAGLVGAARILVRTTSACPSSRWAATRRRPTSTDVVRDVVGQARPAVLLYAGDHDPSGEDIDRDFIDPLRLLGQGRPGRAHR